MEDEKLNLRNPRRGTGESGREAQVIHAIVEEGHGFVFDTAPQLTRSERRRARHVRVIRWVLEFGPEFAWTPAERQAIGMFYELGMQPARAARLVGITRQAFTKRLTRAEAAAQKWYDGLKPRMREKKGRPDARLTIDGMAPQKLPREIAGWGPPEPVITVREIE